MGSLRKALFRIDHDRIAIWRGLQAEKRLEAAPMLEFFVRKAESQKPSMDRHYLERPRFSLSTTLLHIAECPGD